MATDTNLPPEQNFCLSLHLTPIFMEILIIVLAAACAAYNLKNKNHLDFSKFLGSPTLILP